MKIKTTIKVSVLLMFVSIQTFSQNYVKVKLTDDKESLNANLPKDFTDRTFIMGLAAYRNNIEILAGSLIFLKSDGKADIIARYVERNQPPIKSINLSNVLYSSKISSSASFNGSYMVASASASANSIIELVITDIDALVIPENAIPYLEICKASKNVNNVEKSNIFYVRSVKLSTVHSKAFKKIAADGGINGVVFSVDGKVYNSSDQFKTDYVVSVDLINLNKLLMVKNCEEIITNNEINLRNIAQKAEQEALKAETERKIRESEVNVAKAEVNFLKSQVDEMKQFVKIKNNISVNYESQIKILNENLVLAEKKVSEANSQLKVADDNFKVKNEKLLVENIRADNVTNLVEKGNIPLISEVNKLTDSEIEKLGFKKVD